MGKSVPSENTVPEPRLGSTGPNTRDRTCGCTGNIQLQNQKVARQLATRKSGAGTPLAKGGTVLAQMESEAAGRESCNFRVIFPPPKPKSTSFHLKLFTETLVQGGRHGVEVTKQKKGRKTKQGDMGNQQPGFLHGIIHMLPNLNGNYS